MLHDLGLPAAEGAVAEDIAQHLQGLARRRRTRGGRRAQGVGLCIVFQQEARSVVQGRHVIGHGRRGW